MDKKKSTHYEILGVSEDCTHEQIRTAFVDLSKSYHPDRNPDDKQLHDKFVKLNEAYSVLSKVVLRRNYDLSLTYHRQQRFTVNGKPITDHDFWDGKPIYHTPWRDETIWSMRDKTKDNKYYDPNSYYGIKGIKRVSNGLVATGAVVILTLGAIFHYYALNYSRTFTTTQLNLRDQRLGILHNQTRRKAQENGVERQLELLEEASQKPPVPKFVALNQTQEVKATVLKNIDVDVEQD